MAWDLFKRQEKRNQAAAPVVQQSEQPVQPITPPADGNYVNWIKDMLGPTPAEREAQERRLQEYKAKMNGWLGLFQGLGALGDLYYASKGVNPSKPDNTPQAIIEKNAADEKQRLDNLYRNRQAYATQLYNLQRQSQADERAFKLNEMQQKNYESLIKERAEKTRMQDELNQAKNEYWKAMSEKNYEQAEYWRLRGLGVPKESAAKIAKDYASAGLSNAKAATERNMPGGGKTNRGGTSTAKRRTSTVI